MKNRFHWYRGNPIADKIVSAFKLTPTSYWWSVDTFCLPLTSYSCFYNTAIVICIAWFTALWWHHRALCLQAEFGTCLPSIPNRSKVVNRNFSPMLNDWSRNWAAVCHETGNAATCRFLALYFVWLSIECCSLVFVQKLFEVIDFVRNFFSFRGRNEGSFK